MNKKTFVSNKIKLMHDSRKYYYNKYFKRIVKIKVIGQYQRSSNDVRINCYREIYSKKKNVNWKWPILKYSSYYLIFLK